MKSLCAKLLAPLMFLLSSSLLVATAHAAIPVILSAGVDSANTLVIQGTNFGLNPSVTLGTTPLTVQGSPTATEIRADLSGVLPGTHVLKVLFSNGTFALFVVSLVAESAGGTSSSPESWDQKLRCDTQATCPRFVVLSNWNNEAVLDRETGRVWERSPSTLLTDWQGAHSHCNRLRVDNRMGWRLPHVQDLASLIDPIAELAPKLPPGHPFMNVQASLYRSATTSAADAAWDASFSERSAGTVVNPKGGPGFVWCVRGGQGVDSQ